MVSKVSDPLINLPLTLDEAYTLQVLLGFVANDDEAYKVLAKLVALTGEEMECEDYERLWVSLDSATTGTVLKSNANENIVIRINK